MEKLNKILENFDRFEKRSALHYLTRYIKQANSFKDYFKDIFIDGDESSPSEKVQLLTLKMIETIEESTDKKIVNFTNEEVLFWMDLIAELEDNIDTEPNDERVKKALDELSKFEVPFKTSIHGD